MTSKAYICGMGAVTPVGLNAQQTAASIRAGISRNMDTAFADKWFEPFVLSLLPEEVLPPLSPDLAKQSGLTSRQARMVRLASMALAEALAPMQHTASIPLFLGVPETLPGSAVLTYDGFLGQLARQADLTLDLSNSRVLALGRTAGLAALASGIEQLDKGAAQVLVGGVDTYLDLGLLGLLDSENRISGQRVMDGFIPGEGASFLLIGQAPADSGSRTGIAAIAQGFEEGHLYSDKPYRGDGLSETLAELFDQLPPNSEKIKTVFAGLNGENFGAKEWGVAALRNAAHFADGFRLEHPIDCVGDQGAALGPLLVILSAIGLQKGYFEGPCLAWCSSDCGTRAATLVRKE